MTGFPGQPEFRRHRPAPETYEVSTWQRDSLTVGIVLLNIYSCAWFVWAFLVLCLRREPVSIWTALLFAAPAVIVRLPTYVARRRPMLAAAFVLGLAAAVEIVRWLLVKTGHPYWGLHDTQLAVVILGVIPAILVAALFLAATGFKHEELALARRRRRPLLVAGLSITLPVALICATALKSGPRFMSTGKIASSGFCDSVRTCRCASVHESGSQDWFATGDFVICADLRARTYSCFAAYSVPLAGGGWERNDFDWECKGARDAAVEAGGLPSLSGK